MHKQNQTKRISVVITSYNEPKTIGNTIASILDRTYSGFFGEIQLIIAAPDRPTLSAAKTAVTKFKHQDCVFIQDDNNGKPTALNLCLKEVKGAITILTDGDISFKKNSVKILIDEFERYPHLVGVSGRQISIDTKNNYFGYISHLFTEALHVSRIAQMNGNSSQKYFPLSGYIMAVRTELLNFTIPTEVLVDDAYISLMITKDGGVLGYNPEAAAYVSYPKHLTDYFKQKIRSTGGYIQLKQMGLVDNSKRARTLIDDLKMFLFPLRYASNLKEFFWSLLLYPMRLLLWIRIYSLKFFAPKKLVTSWIRVESTK